MRTRGGSYGRRGCRPFIGLVTVGLVLGVVAPAESGSSPEAIGHPDVARSGNWFEATFLAVRQGDAALYEGPCGELGLIDVNRFRHQEVLDALDAIGSRDLTWISVSHYDADHLGGILDVATATGVTVGAIYDRGGDRDAKDSDTYREYYDWVTAAGLRVPVDIGDTFSLCSGEEEITFTVVSAGTDGTAVGGVAVTRENDRGLCLHVEYGDFDLATCGDISGTDDGTRTDVETPAGAVIGDIEFAKVGHHGSANSSNATWVTTLSAQAAVVSVGKNSNGHPDPGVVARWQNAGTVLYQTQDPDDNALIDGDVTVSTDGVTRFTVVASASGRSDTYDLDILMEYARRTWASLDAMVYPNGLPGDHRSNAGGTADYTSPTNIAVYLWSTIAASELGIITPSEAAARVGQTLATLDGLERHAASGQFFNPYRADTGATLPGDSNDPARGPFLSSVDNAWLATALMMVPGAVPDHAAAANAILADMDFGFYVDGPTGLFSRGYWPDVDEWEGNYDIANTEARIISYIGIVRGNVPPAHYFKLWRTLPATCDWSWQETKPTGTTVDYLGEAVFNGHYSYRGIHVVPSWGGSMFEALMVPLLVPEEEWGANSWGVNHANYLAAQIDHGISETEYGYWGFSPADDPSAVRYVEYGVDGIGMRPDGYPSNNDKTLVDLGFEGCPGRDPQPLPDPADYTNGVVTPHAAFLALDFHREAALRNLADLRRDFPVYGPLGFYDSVNVATGEVSAFQLALDQGMIMAAVANALTDDGLQGYFAPLVQAELQPLLGLEDFFPPLADLSLVKSVDEPAPPIGGTVVFTVAVTNDGPSDATGVQVMDQLLSGYSYASDDGGGAYDSGTGIWTIGAVADGSTATLHITAQVLESGDYSNVAEVIAASQPDPDSTPANDDGDQSEDDEDSASTAPVPACNGLPATHVGTSGDDILIGTDGADVIIARKGNDVVDGRGGDDTICAGSGNDLILGGLGDDAIFGDAGRDTVDYTGAPAAVSVNLQLKRATGGHGTDRIENVENIIGSAFDDTLRGNAKRNIIYGGAGDDGIQGLGGNDDIYGEAGNDNLNGRRGDDLLHGGPDIDQATFIHAPGGVTADLLSGTVTGDGTDTITAIENLFGSRFSDILWGNGQPNVIKGSRGGDTLYGRGGDDLLIGNKGNDTANGGPGTDTCRTETKINCE